ncbi:MAG: TVP38/TMEM64 family protein [Desulfomonile tiedjei]|nr:TVP38/TMEM64 family protein [Desulfomonile tiedjei]
MEPCSPEEKKRLIISLAVLGGMTLVLLVLAATGKLAPLVQTLLETFQGREQLRKYVESWGTAAPAAFVFVQALQVVLAPIPGEFTGAVGGFIFGVAPNVLYSTIGLGVGSAIAFLASRTVGLPLVKLVVPCHCLEKFHFLVNRRGTFIALILFTLPGFPKDILCFILGLSPMGFLTFLWVCTLGRIPGTMMLSFSGSAFYNQDWYLLGLVAVVCLAFIGAFLLARDRIEVWLKKKSGAAF